MHAAQAGNASMVSNHQPQVDLQMLASFNVDFAMVDDSKMMSAHINGVGLDVPMETTQLLCKPWQCTWCAKSTFASQGLVKSTCAWPATLLLRSTLLGLEGLSMGHALAVTIERGSSRNN
eukprot:538989-Amphidinium_carterae.1